MPVTYHAIRTVVLLGIGVVQVCGLLQGEDWARFRGPSGAGQSEATSIPAVWTTEDYKWRVEIPGKGHSSPVVEGGTVFVMSSLQNDATRIVRSLKSIDGSLLWEVRLSASTSDLGRSSFYDIASPAVDAKHIYAAWGSPKGYFVVALNRQDGREIWRRNLGSFYGDHGFGPSPICFENMVILANDQSGPSLMFALDHQTGQTLWTTERRTTKSSYSTPIIYRPKTGIAQLILASTTHGVSSLDPKTGQLNWELPGLFGRDRVVASPVVGRGLIFAQCGRGGGGTRMIAIRPPNSRGGKRAQVVYELEGSLPYVPTPITGGKWLFLISDGGVASCIEIDSGRRIWRERIGGHFFGSPVRVGKRIYVISKEGEIVVVAAEPRYKLLGRMDLEEPSYSTPAIADGVMYIRTFSHLMAIGGENPVSTR